MADQKKASLTYTMQETLNNITDNTELWGGGNTGTPKVMRVQDKLLSNAIKAGDIEKVREALAQKADTSIPIRMSLGEITPIFVCAAEGYTEIAELLINHDPEIIHKRLGFDGATALHHAATNNQPEMCEFLVKAGISVDEKDELGRTALMDAAEIPSLAVMDVMLENKANTNIEDKDKDTAISYCLDMLNKDDNKFYEATKKLLDGGADVNYTGKYSDRSFLHHAAASGNMEMVHELVEERNAKAGMKDQAGNTPCAYAEKNGHKEIATYLRQKMLEQKTESAAKGGTSCTCFWIKCMFQSTSSSQ